MKLEIAWFDKYLKGKKQGLLSMCSRPGWRSRGLNTH